MLRRWWRGLTSAFGTLLLPLGKLGCFGIGHLRFAERLERGLVILLPGIQGKSNTEMSVALGLEDAGIDLAIEVHDWTTGFWPLFAYHLRGSRRNRIAAARLAARICEYRAQYPKRPVHLIGHSGGAGLALMTLEELPADVRVTSVILLAAAVSPSYELEGALSRAEVGVWSFRSQFDLFFLGLSTVVLGTFDGHHTPAAGMTGFRRNTSPGDVDRLNELPFRAGMLASGNLAGHFGCTNRVFVADWIAPVIRDSGMIGPSSRGPVNPSTVILRQTP